VAFHQPLRDWLVVWIPTKRAGGARSTAVFDQAGFSRFRRAAETPLNLILEARP